AGRTTAGRISELRPALPAGRRPGGGRTRPAAPPGHLGPKFELLRPVMSRSPGDAFADVLDTDPALFDVRTSAAGPAGKLPLTEELLRNAPSGDLFGWTQDVGMGWRPDELG